MELYLSGQFGFIHNQHRQFGNGSVWTVTRNGCDGPEPLPTLPTPLTLIKYSISHHIVTLSVRRLCSFGRSFTFHCPICDPTDIG